MNVVDFTVLKCPSGRGFRDPIFIEPVITKANGE